MNMINLPDDIISRILSKTKESDVKAVGATCKALRHMVYTQPVWPRLLLRFQDNDMEETKNLWNRFQRLLSPDGILAIICEWSSEPLQSFLDQVSDQQRQKSFCGTTVMQINGGQGVFPCLESFSIDTTIGFSECYLQHDIWQTPCIVTNAVVNNGKALSLDIFATNGCDVDKCLIASSQSSMAVRIFADCQIWLNAYSILDIKIMFGKIIELSCIVKDYEYNRRRRLPVSFAQKLYFDIEYSNYPDGDHDDGDFIGLDLSLVPTDCRVHIEMRDGMSLNYESSWNTWDHLNDIVISMQGFQDTSFLTYLNPETLELEHVESLDDMSEWTVLETQMLDSVKHLRLHGRFSAEHLNMKKLQLTSFHASLPFSGKEDESQVQDWIMMLKTADTTCRTSPNVMTWVDFKWSIS